ncbi:MAG: DUF4445 domain-containing protein [Rhizobiales bacterium]|nr:DUF4445 domain-containing protein [Hyphomicrobiales bacterium]
MPSGRRGHFPLGTPVLDAARALGVYIESVCGGRGICGRCQVTVAEGKFAKHGITSAASHLAEFTDTEARYRRLRSLADDRRLSCSAKIVGDSVIDVPQDVQMQRQVVRKRAENKNITRNPAIRLHYVEVEQPDMEQPLGDLDRLLVSLNKEWQLTDIHVESWLRPLVQKTLRKGDWKVTAAIHNRNGVNTLVGLWPEFRDIFYGIAVDIGSTTIACHLSDMMSGRTIASSGTSNPQIRLGEDLMSRVSYVMMNPGGEKQLTQTVRDAVGSLIEKVCAEADISSHDILDSVFVGNPVMHHLFLGIDPTELGGAPFALAVSGALDFPARELGLNLNPGARTYILPCIAGHVGADAAAATLAEAPHREEFDTLLVDIGTNAEIILGNKQRVVAASSPTGPAFEGAEISCGQRAAPGAIERVRIDPETLQSRIKIIGVDEWSDDPAFDELSEAVGVTGVCGSGIIEAIGEMFLAGIIDEDGVIRGEMAEKSDRVFADGRTFSYLLWTGKIELKITQTDVRAIQLAKAALYAGVKLLMDKLEIDHVSKIKLAGAFGSYIDPKYAVLIGLLPDCDLKKVSGVGNAAGTGARMALLSRDHRTEVEELVTNIEKLETALEPKFQEHFVNAMAFPNKVDLFPNLETELTLPPKMPPANNADGTGRRRRRRNR